MNSRVDEILSLDNVPLRLPIAGVATRGLAFAIDSLILTAVALLVVIGGLSLGIMLQKSAPWVFAGATFLLFLLQWGYFALFEIHLQGRTPGKAVLKLRVVTQDGGLPARSALILRNLLLLIPDLFIGVFLMAADPLARRAGDRVAGTLVIREKPDFSPLILGRAPAGWRGESQAVVEAYLERAATLQPDSSYAIGERILRWLERDAPEFLDGVDRDGRHPASILYEALRVEGR